MAKAEMKMPEDFLLKISKLGSNFDSVADTVLQAGGEVVLKRVKSNLSSVIGRGTKFKSRTTGELEGALGLSPSKLNRDTTLRSASQSLARTAAATPNLPTSSNTASTVSLQSRF